MTEQSQNKGIIDTSQTIWRHSRDNIETYQKQNRDRIRTEQKQNNAIVETEQTKSKHNKYRIEAFRQKKYRI